MLKPLLQLLSMHMNTTACMCVHILIRIGLQPCYVREMSGLFFFPFWLSYFGCDCYYKRTEKHPWTVQFWKERNQSAMLLDQLVVDIVNSIKMR